MKTIVIFFQYRCILEFNVGIVSEKKKWLKNNNYL